SLRRLRPASRRRALPRQLADRALQGRRRLGARALARPQAPFAPRRDRSDLPARAGKGLHADPDAALLQERPGQGGDRAGAREVEAGPPRGDQGKGEPPRDRPRHRRRAPKVSLGASRRNRPSRGFGIERGFRHARTRRGTTSGAPMEPSSSSTKKSSRTWMRSTPKASRTLRSKSCVGRLLAIAAIRLSLTFRFSRWSLATRCLTRCRWWFSWLP